MHIIEASITTNMNGRKNTEDSRKHLNTGPSFKSSIFKTYWLLLKTICISLVHRKPMTPTNAKNRVSYHKHGCLNLLWEVILILQRSYPTSTRRNGSWHLVKGSSDSHDFTPPRLCAKWAECARGTHRAVWLDGLKELSVMLSCLERYL